MAVVCNGNEWGLGLWVSVLSVLKEINGNDVRSGTGGIYFFLLPIYTKDGVRYLNSEPPALAMYGLSGDSDRQGIRYICCLSKLYTVLHGQNSDDSGIGSYLGCILFMSTRWRDV
jgi:hypothetical protein